MCKRKPPWIGWSPFSLHELSFEKKNIQIGQGRSYVRSPFFIDDSRMMRNLNRKACPVGNPNDPQLSSHNRILLLEVILQINDSLINQFRCGFVEGNF
ncbi:hypothetical protein LMG33818_000114 [Halomonadaceae bacterium LMG 33818]